MVVHLIILYSHIVLQHRLLPDLFRGPKKLSRTELPLAGTHVGDHPDSDNLDIASQGRNFYRVVAVRAIYGAFHIRPFTAVYHSGSLYCSNRTIVIAALQANSTSKNRYRSKISQYKIIALAHRVLHAFHRYIADRVFTFVGRRKPMAYLAERVMHYGSGNIAYLPGYPQTISLLQNLSLIHI